MLTHVSLGEAGHLSTAGALTHYDDREYDHHADKQQVRKYAGQERIVADRDIVLLERGIRIRLVIALTVVCYLALLGVSGVYVVDENADIRHRIGMRRL